MVWGRADDHVKQLLVARELAELQRCCQAVARLTAIKHRCQNECGMQLAHAPRLGCGFQLEMQLHEGTLASTLVVNSVRLIRHTQLLANARLAFRCRQQTEARLQLRWSHCLRRHLQESSSFQKGAAGSQLLHLHWRSPAAAAQGRRDILLQEHTPTSG